MPAADRPTPPAAPAPSSAPRTSSAPGEAPADAAPTPSTSLKLPAVPTSHAASRRAAALFFASVILSLLAVVPPLLIVRRTLSDHERAFAALLEHLASDVPTATAEIRPWAERVARLPQMALVAVYEPGGRPCAVAAADPAQVKELEPLWTRVHEPPRSVRPPREWKRAGLRYVLRAVANEPHLPPRTLLLVESASRRPGALLARLGVALLPFMLLTGTSCWLAWRLYAERYFAPLRELLEIARAAHDQRLADPESATAARLLSPVENLRLLVEALPAQREREARYRAEQERRADDERRQAARQLRAAFHMAATDPLTGLNNRRALDDNLETLIGHCRTSGCNVSLVAIDVDHLKTLNDTLGHEAGDGLLRFVGELLRGTLREEDIPVRLGGDEFLLILPATDAAEATRIAVRVAALFAQRAGLLECRPQPALSWGVADHRTWPGADAAELLRRADAALYSAKRRPAPRADLTEPLPYSD